MCKKTKCFWIPVLITGLLFSVVPLAAEEGQSGPAASFRLNAPYGDDAEKSVESHGMESLAVFLFPPAEEKTFSMPYTNSPLQVRRDDYQLWKRRLARANGKIVWGAVMEIVGLAMFIPAIGHVLFLPEGDRISSAGKVRVAVGSILGGGLIIFGSINIFKGTSQKRKLIKEGRIKGYIQAGLLPAHNALGVRVTAVF